MTYDVHNLKTGAVYSYSGDKREALITTWLLENGQASQIHNDAVRNGLKILKGKYGLYLGDLGVLSYTEEA